MNTQHSNYTGRFHRTIESAFGPYARGGIYEKPSEFTIADKVITGLSGVILFALLLAILTGVI
jgi:hypothetical protein